MGVNCSYLQRNILSHASIQFNKNMYYTLKSLNKNNRATDMWNTALEWENDEIINFIKLNYLLNSFNYFLKSSIA